jgi:hypothetical protein
MYEVRLHALKCGYKYSVEHRFNAFRELANDVSPVKFACNQPFHSSVTFSARIHQGAIRRRVPPELRTLFAWRAAWGRTTARESASGMRSAQA